MYYLVEDLFESNLGFKLERVRFLRQWRRMPLNFLRQWRI